MRKLMMAWILTIAFCVSGSLYLYAADKVEVPQVSFKNEKEQTYDEKFRAKQYDVWYAFESTRDFERKKEALYQDNRAELIFLAVIQDQVESLIRDGHQVDGWERIRESKVNRKMLSKEPDSDGDPAWTEKALGQMWRAFEASEPDEVYETGFEMLDTIEGGSSRTYIGVIADVEKQKAIVITRTLSAD